MPSELVSQIFGCEHCLLIDLLLIWHSLIGEAAAQAKTYILRWDEAKVNTLALERILWVPFLPHLCLSCWSCRCYRSHWCIPLRFLYENSASRIYKCLGGIQCIWGFWFVTHIDFQIWLYVASACMIILFTRSAGTSCLLWRACLAWELLAKAQRHCEITLTCVFCWYPAHHFIIYVDLQRSFATCNVDFADQFTLFNDVYLPVWTSDFPSFQAWWLDTYYPLVFPRYGRITLILNHLNRLLGISQPLVCINFQVFLEKSLVRIASYA